MNRKRAKPKKYSSFDLGEEISSSEDEASGDDKQDDGEETSDIESPEQKRVRLAKEYIARLGSDNADIVSGELRDQRLKEAGEYYQDLSSHFKSIDQDNCTRKTMNDHKEPVTALAVSSNEGLIFSASKDNSIIMWDVESGNRDTLKQRWMRQTHPSEQSYQGELLSLAISSDDRYLAAGGRDQKLRIYDRRMKFAEVKVFSGHRDNITALAFQRGTYELFSGSYDRSIKHWTLNEMGYVESLFGHQDVICSLDCANRCRPVSASTDRTIRLWKVEEETHSVFRGHSASIDAVQLLTENTFVSGSQDGRICLWKDSVKSPVRTINAAHGYQRIGAEASSNANWIASIGSIKMSNIFASGSCDGFVRIWQADAESKVLSSLLEFPCTGYVNALHISSNIIVCGCGREPKLGRWGKIHGNHNSVVLVKFDHSDL